MEVALARADRRSSASENSGGGHFGLSELGLGGSPSEEFILRTIGVEDTKGKSKGTSYTESPCCVPV